MARCLGVTLALIVMALSTACGSSSSCQSGTCQNTSLTVLAGAPSGAGSLDGTGPAARFSYPCGVAADPSGNVYVADQLNSTIRKITPAGVVTTLAGSAAQTGSSDGTGPAARFHNPWGVAADGSGNVYVADTDNRTIRKITPAGVVSTLAGSPGQIGVADGTGPDARFFVPQGLAVDGSGSVYVADTGSSTIRRITAAGVVTTLAGSPSQRGSADGTGTAALFRFPNGVGVDDSGNVYVADSGNFTIRKITPAGEVSTIAGSAGQAGNGDGTGSVARFSYPSGGAVDGSGNFYVADLASSIVRKITPAGVVTTLAGSAWQFGSADGTGSTAQFDNPLAVAVDGSGHVYVADALNSTIRKIATPAGVVSTLAGSAPQSGSTDGTGSAARFWNPAGVAVDGSGNAYVADRYNSTIRKITPAGMVSTLAGSARLLGSTDGPGSAAYFRQPWGLAVDGSGNVYVADSGNSTLRKITSAGVVSTLAGSPGQTGGTDGTGSAARFFGPSGLAVDGSGNVYVADMYNSTVRKITPAGVVSTLAGAAGETGSADGTGSAARFLQPDGVAVDASGNVYVADRLNDTIRKITSEGVVSTFAGSPGEPGSADGTGSAARFYNPQGMALDLSGNLYVADSNNSTIRKITPAGIVTTVVGTPGKSGTSAGPLPSRLFGPAGVAFVPMTGRLVITVPDAVLEASF